MRIVSTCLDSLGLAISGLLANSDGMSRTEIDNECANFLGREELGFRFDIPAIPVPKRQTPFNPHPLSFVTQLAFCHSKRRTSQLPTRAISF
jgi:hypothetical protein